MLPIALGLAAAGISLGAASGATGAGPAEGRGGSGFGVSSLAFPMAFDSSAGQAPASATCQPLTSNLTGVVLPSALRGPYGVDELLNRSGHTANATGEAIGVIAWGEGYDPSDLATFWQDYYPSSFPRPTVIPVPLDNASPPSVNAPSDPSCGSLELTLDIEWAASMAPGATIYAIYVPPGPSPPSYSPVSSQILDALNFSLRLGNLTALSLSFGEPQGAEPGFESYMSTLLEKLGNEGTTVLVASGDDGGSAASPEENPCSAGPNVDFPAASPYVVAVGGTNATAVGSGETAWDLSGGGPSLYSADAAPSWQRLGGVAGYTSELNEREVPDVAASAQDNGFYFGGSLYPADGTSFASPLWAGIVADIAAADGGHLGPLDPALYSLGAAQEAGGPGPPVFHEVLHGSSCYYDAGPGWNRVTGWGDPNASALASALRGATFLPLNVTLDPSSDLVAGSEVEVGVELPATGAGPLEGRPLQLALLDPANDSPTWRGFGTLPSSAGTLWSLNFTVPSGMVGDWFNVSAFASNGSTLGVGTAVFTAPPAPPPSGPSVWEILLDYQLPILVGFLALLLAVRWATERRRARPTGPSMSSVFGTPPTPPGATPATAAAGTKGATPGVAATAAGEGVSPFCWRCGTMLKGSEPTCPSCGMHLAR